MFAKENIHFKKIALSLFAIGVLLRLISFLLNRSLWIDEALLAENFLHRDYSGLLKPLENNQATPILFLWIEKFMFSNFGQNDFSLRIVPFIISIACLWLFFALAKNILGQTNAALCMMLLFATSIYLMRYTLEVKQYQGDMLVSLFFVTLLLKEKNFSSKSLWWQLLICGTVAVWFSNVAIVILFATGCYILYKTKALGQFKSILYWAPLFICWVVSFGIYFFLFIYHHPTEQLMLEFWATYFPPANFFSSSFISWFIQSYLAIVFALMPWVSKFNPLLYAYSILALTGFIYLFKKNKPVFLWCFVPLILHFAMALFHKYPVADKFLLYQFPFFYITAGCGLIYIEDFLQKKKLPATFFSYGLVFCFICLSLVDLYQRYPFEMHETKKSISYFQQQTPAATLYVHPQAAAALRFYIATGFVKKGTDIKWMPQVNKADSLAAFFNNAPSRFALLFGYVKPDFENEVITLMQQKFLLKQDKKFTGSSCYFFEKK